MDTIALNQDIKTDLENAFGTLTSLLDDLSEDQLNIVPFEGSWTAGQVADHLQQSYSIIKMMHGNTIATERAVLEKVDSLKSIFLNFDKKLKSPDFIIPSNEPFIKVELLGKLKAKAHKITQFAQAEDLSLTCTDYEFPGFGAMTRIEWLHFIVFHTQRHTHQLRNIIKALNVE